MGIGLMVAWVGVGVAGEVFVDGPSWESGVAVYEFTADSCSGEIRFQLGGFVTTGVVFGIPDAMLHISVKNTSAADGLLLAPDSNPRVLVTKKGKQSVVVAEKKTAVLEQLAYSLGFNDPLYQEFDRVLLAANTLKPGESLTSALAFNYKFPEKDRKYEVMLECPNDIVRFTLSPRP